MVVYVKVHDDRCIWQVKHLGSKHGSYKFIPKYAWEGENESSIRYGGEKGKYMF